MQVFKSDMYYASIMLGHVVGPLRLKLYVFNEEMI